MLRPNFGMLWLMLSFFFFNDTATTEIYTLSLHDALPISCSAPHPASTTDVSHWQPSRLRLARSEEHTSELQSQSNLVCRLLLEKKKICLSQCSAGPMGLQDTESLSLH